MKDEFTYIGENVRKARVAKNLTLEQLAEFVGISGSFLGVAERGSSGFSTETIIKIANVLGVSTDSLLLESTPDNQQDSSKLDILVATLKPCSDEDIDFLINYIMLCKTKGLFMPNH